VSIFVQAIADATKSVNPEAIVPVSRRARFDAEDAEFILQPHPRGGWFYGASSMERLPVETAITSRSGNSRRFNSNNPDARAKKRPAGGPSAAARSKFG